MRKLPLALSCAAILGTTNAFAIGLGELQVQSFLNQPLRADIRLVDLRPGEVDALRVRLADEQSFERAGYARSAVSGRIHLQLQNGSKPRILLSSDRPIRDPALGLVIQVDGPDGTLSRDYAILLDPVGYQPVRLAPAPERKSVDTTPRASEVMPSSPPVSRPTQTGGVLKGDTYGPVAEGETLWSITQRVAPKGVLPQQAMDAIRLANPQAFANPASNDTLLAGSSLRIPDATAMRQVPVASASASLPADSAKPVDKPAATPEKAPAEPVAAKGDSHLAIVQPAMTPSEAGVPGYTPVAAPVVGEVVQTAPAQDAMPPSSTLVEQLEGEKVENERLTERITAMEAHLAKMEELIHLKELQVQALEKRLQEAGASPSSAVTPAVAPEPKADSGSLMDSLMSPVTLAAGGLGALLVALLVGRMRRRREVETGLEEDLITEAAPVAAATVAVAAAEDTSSSAPADAPVAESAVAEVSSFAVDPEHEALEEAEVMAAYGLHDRALKVLDDAIQGLPDSAALHARRVRAFHDMGTRDDFVRAAEAYREKFPAEDDSHWESIRALGESTYPDMPLFGGFELPKAPVNAPVVAEEPSAEADMGSSQAADEFAQLEHQEVNPDLALPLEDLGLPSSMGSYNFADSTPEPLDLPPLELNLPDVASLTTPTSAKVEDAAPESMEPESAELMESLDIPQPEVTLPTASPDVESELFAVPEDVGPSDAKPGISDEDLLILGIDAANFAASEPTPSVAKTEEAPAAVPGGSFDEQSTKLDIAQAFIDMSDTDSARALLEEIIDSGDDSLQGRARTMLESLQG